MPDITVVVLVDDDGDEFPIAFPGVWKQTRNEDIANAFGLANENIERGAFTPNGELRFDRIEYQEGAVITREP